MANELSKEIIKKFGSDAFVSGQNIIENPHEVIPVSPKLDAVLGGGIPGGSVVTLAGPEKSGKMQPLDAQIQTKNGPVLLGDLKVGDLILDHNLEETVVEGIYPHGVQEVYKVEFDDGASCECGLEHLWEVDNGQVISLQDILLTYPDQRYGIPCHIYSSKKYRYITEISKSRLCECACIKISNPRGLYLTNDFIVTHNTILSLHIASKCQAKDRPIFYLNVEGRIKPRDLQGIKGLDPEKVTIIQSYKGKILTAENYLSICLEIINTIPRSVVIIDSISQLCTEKEFSCEMGEQQRAPGAVLLAQFCKKIANTVPVNDNIVILIQHMIANTSGYGAALMVSGGRKVKYSSDVGLVAKGFKFLRGGTKDENESVPAYGQEVEWQTTSTAFIAPGQKTTSVIRYGVGIDEITENILLGMEMGFIKQSASWLELSYMGENPQKIQGRDKLYQFFTQAENAPLYEQLQKEIRSLYGN